MTHPATVLARLVVDRLVGAGVEEAVLCPGSRNAPLAFALEAAANAGRLRLHTRLDERTAGFLALGLARGGRRPAAVVTTSGTAAANLHPAVLEAAHAGLPLVAVTADRPAALRGTGANQTTDQVRLFGAAAAFADLAVPDVDTGEIAGEIAGEWDRLLQIAEHGPTHLNVQLSPPLVPDAPAPEAVAPADAVDGTGKHVPRARPSHAAPPDSAPLLLTRGPRTVVVAGDDAGPPARVFAESAGWPLLAEPTSGSRTGSHAIRCYRLLLDTPLGDRVQRAVVFGHPTVSRPVEALLGRADVEVVSVPHRGRWTRRPWPVADEAWTLVASSSSEDAAWLADWRSADESLAARLDGFVDALPGLTPYRVAAVVSAAVPPGGLLYVGASNPVRDLDLMAARYEVGGRRLVLANRGLAGIDGTVSSAIGAALARPSTRAFALLGDVTFLHDATGLVIGPDELRPDLTLVVVNDDGGSIFATLEQGAPAYAASYDRLFGTPHHVDLAALCAATGTPHRRVESPAELAAALADQPGGIDVVEAVVRRDDRRAFDERIRSLACD